MDEEELEIYQQEYNEKKKQENSSIIEKLLTT